MLAQGQGGPDRAGRRGRQTVATGVIVTALCGAGVLTAAPGRAWEPVTFGAGSAVTLVAHVPGTDAVLARVPLDGLTQAQGADAIHAAEAAVGHRVVRLYAAAPHGRKSLLVVPVSGFLSAPRVAVPDPATLEPGFAYSARVVLTLKGVAVAALARRAAPLVAVEPKSAALRTGVLHPVVFDRGYDGSVLDPTHLPALLVAALHTGKGVLPVKAVSPRYAGSSLATVIVVHTASNRLQLFIRGRLAHTYVVATGQAGYPSPHGLFHVIAREPAPIWTNPHDAWSLSLPDVIGPGPDNPLGTRALQLDSPGILIHGIPLVENATLGSNASHGCVRMSRAEIESLYPRVPLGTPVLMLS